MIGRTSELLDTITYLEMGVDVTVSGAPGSGRTLFLSALTDHLIDHEYVVHRLSGISALREVPLAVLQRFAAADFEGRRALSVGAAIRTFSELAERGRLIVLIDDADQLDDTSWGAILAAQSQVDFRIVSAQLPLRIEARTDLGVPRRRAYIVHLPPFRLHEMETLLARRAGGPVDANTVSRIFGKSAGLPGLSIGMLEVGMQSGTIREHDGVWVSTDTLWSAALDRLVERQIRVQGGRAREALERLSVAGELELEAAARLVGERMLEKLESRGLVQFSVVGGGLTATITPPLIAEYFRHSPLRARTARIARLSEKYISSHDQDSIVQHERVMSPPDAVFTRLMHDHLQHSLNEAQHAWQSTRTPADLLAYASALCQSDVAVERVNALFATIPSGTGITHARLHALHAHWVAETSGEQTALRLLMSKAAAAGEFAPLLDAAAVRIRIDGAGYDGDVRADLPVSAEMPTPVVRALRAVRAVALLSSGHVAAAGEELSFLPEEDTGPGWAEIEAARVLYLIGIAHPQDAIRHAYHSLERARTALDGDAIRSMAYAAAFCQLLRGDYREVSALVETALATGFPRAGARSPLLGLLCMASIVAGRNGNPELAQTRLAQAERLTASDGPLPTMATSWPRSQLLMSEGQHDEALALLREGAERLWNRGARWAAVQEWLIELELQPDAARLAELGPRLELIDGEFTQALQSYVEALAFSDPVRLEASAHRLLETGRPGFAITALRHAAQLHSDGGQESEAGRLHSAAEELAVKLPPGSFDATRFRSADIILTRRELQLARLAASGLTNAEIATRLVLSVRTVESHLHRVMRKAGVSSRADLAAFLNGSPSSGT